MRIPIDWSGSTNVFYLALLCGFLLILVLKTLIPGLWGGVLVAIALGAILLSAVVKYRNARTVDKYQLGDNVYYLGLLYTLISLGYVLVSLFLFDPSGDSKEKVDELVGSFGIALSSTLFGIVGRIHLHNVSREAEVSDQRSEVEPAPSEKTEVIRPTPARPEATFPIFPIDEARQLRRELREARDAMSHFNRVTTTQAYQTKEHTEKMAAEFVMYIDRLSTQGREQAQQSLDETATHWQMTFEGIRTELEKLVAESRTQTFDAIKSVQAHWMDVADQIASKIEGTASRFDNLSRSASPVIETLKTLESTLQTSNRQLLNLSEAINAVQISEGHYADVAEKAAEISDQLSQNAEVMTAQFSRNIDFGRDTEQRLAEHSQNLQAHFEGILATYQTTLKTISDSDSKYLDVMENTNAVNEILRESATTFSQQSDQSADQLKAVAEQLSAIVSTMSAHQQNVAAMSGTVDSLNLRFSDASAQINVFKDMVQIHTGVVQERMKTEEKLAQQAKRLSALLSDFSDEAGENNPNLKNTIQRILGVRERS